MEVLVQAIVALVSAFLLFLGTVVTVRGKAGGDQPKVTSEQVEASKDPGVEALALALSMSRRVEKLEESNARLVVQNKLFRRVLLEVADLLRKIPPLPHDTILAHILDRLPDLGDDAE